MPRRYDPRRIYMGRFALVVIAVICAPTLTAQQPAPADTSLAFEVASIRPSAAGQRYALRFQPDASMSVTSAVVERLTLMAYDQREDCPTPSVTSREKTGGL